MRLEERGKRVVAVIYRQVTADRDRTRGPARTDHPRAHMELQPKLIDVRVPDNPQAAVLVMHGGASRNREAMVSPTQLSVLRMVPIAKHLARAGKGRLAVFRLLNSRRGWDTTTTPVHDAHWALDEMARRLGGPIPTALVGHSLGGRAALFTADREEVTSVVALAPWVYANDRPRRQREDSILIVHGDRDRIASLDRAKAVADRLGAELRVVEGGKHAMLAHAGEFRRHTTDWVLHTLVRA